MLRNEHTTPRTVDVIGSSVVRGVLVADRDEPAIRASQQVPMRPPSSGLEVTAPRERRCLVMGILNVTPDSFSDGGCFADAQAAAAHGLAMSAAGADLVDVGGESTRPGAERVDAGEERRRVLAVVGELARAGVAVSVDTTRAEVAEAAIEAGAVMVNDVSGGTADTRMAHLIADTGAGWVLMHGRGPSQDMYSRAHYDEVVGDVIEELSQRVDDAVAVGVDPRQLVIDPGLGFAKHARHNWTLLAGLPRLVALGLPVLVGTSRKSFLGSLLADADGTVRPVGRRDAATLATTVLAAEAGAWAVRVHDVPSSVDAVLTVAASRRAQGCGARSAERLPRGREPVAVPTRIR